MRARMSEFKCDGSHHHTPLEGYIRGQGPRTQLAENYLQYMAKVIAEVLINRTENEEEILAAQGQQLQEEDHEPEEDYEPEMMEGLHDERALLPDRGQEAQVQERPEEARTAFRANQQLKKQVAIRAVDSYVAST